MRRGVLLVAVILLFGLPGVLSLGTVVRRGMATVGPEAVRMATSGGEPVSIYNVMKVQNGLTLYEDPRRAPLFPTTLYNAGFYYTYAWATTLAADASLAARVAAMRFLTLGLAVAGLAAVIIHASRRWLAPEAWAASLTAIVMAGSAVTLGPLLGWWLLTARPDVGAVALATIGLVLAMRLGLDSGWKGALPVGLCFAGAWLFKQSCVFTLGSIFLVALWQRKIGFLIGLVAPVLAAMALAVTLLGPEYRYNTMFAPSLSTFDPANLLAVVVQVARKGAFPILAAALALANLNRIPWLTADERQLASNAWWVSLGGALATCSRTGSEVNYYFEFWAATSILVVVEAAWLTSRAAAPGGIELGSRSLAKGTALGVLALASLGTSAVDALRLVGGPESRLGSALLVSSPSRASEVERLLEFARARGGPILCQPALAGLAWDPSLPVPFLDDYRYFHERAQQRGLLEQGGIPGMIARRVYSLIVLEPAEVNLAGLAVAAGYRREPGWSRMVVLTRPKADGWAMGSR